MKHLKKFNESIDNNDLQKWIDTILDNISDSGIMNDSIQKFLDANSKDEIVEISSPKGQSQGQSFWSYMSDPSNHLYLWKDKSGAWNQLEFDNKDDEEEDLGKSNDKRRENDIKRYFKKYPELREDLINLYHNIEKGEKIISDSKKVFSDKYKKITKSDYNLYQKLFDYCKSTESILNQFGIKDYGKLMDDNGEIDNIDNAIIK